MSGATGLSTLSTVVMAHPSRRAQAEGLRGRHPRLDISVVFDPEPEGPPSALRTAAVAWSRVGPAATHHLVLQDDVTLCRGFEHLVTFAIGTRPSEAIVLFSEWSGPTGQVGRLAALLGRTWTPVAEHSVPPVGIVLSRELALGFADFISSTARPGMDRDSQLLYEYLNSAGVVPHVCVPNLVEHDLFATSSIWPGNVTKGLRRSMCFADDVAGPWDFRAGPSALPPFIPYHSYKSLSAMTAFARDADNHWRYGHTAEVLAAMGVDLSGLEAEFGESLAEFSDRLGRLVSPAFLHESWLTAAALGMSVPPDRMHPDGSRPSVVSNVVGTLVQGPLRRVLSATALAHLAEVAEPFLFAGLTRGEQLRREQAAAFADPDWRRVGERVSVRKGVTP
ncbi:hypothetical protein AB0I28_19860 [Phytomonospora sp. NPDC050363]|uniref:hypothetical protein n=1 Tax=Phytomonospora sp. NPDC050363 TaxID=3155642 RepID=UPI00340BCED1